MNVVTIFKAVDALIAFRDATRRFKGASPPPPPAADTAVSSAAPSPGMVGQLETRLASVVVAALKEAFDRDHVRLELERTQLAEARQRAEAALQAELRRQAADRELSRLRLIAGTAMVGWIASVAIAAVGFADASLAARIALVAGWLLLLGALGAAFTAQGAVGSAQTGTSGTPEPGGDPPGGTAAASSLWLLIVGLAATAASLLL